MRAKVLIIAEAGVNHNGDINKAIELIEKAAEAGADIVKFQTFITELNISKKLQKQIIK
jgi:N,N'-diacetyllegionaminate synthase